MPAASDLASRQTDLVLRAQPDANTLSGLFMVRRARMPLPGEEIRAGDWLPRVLGINSVGSDLPQSRVLALKPWPSMVLARKRVGSILPGNGLMREA
jgi:hypothetical protein